MRPGDVYVHIASNGAWKSTDYGSNWVKVSTGLNGDKQDSGRQWGCVIDPNPRRDPSVPPAIYVNQGYGANGLWKSTNGGVDWEDVWTNNVFKADGVTNISSDVGNDMAAPFTLGGDVNHVIIFLHSYWGTGGNNGIFETTDGGKSWRLHPTTFNFQPHADLLFPIDATAWGVGHGTTYPNTEVWRTIDAGQTWQLGATVSNGFGNMTARAGNAVYGPGGSGLYKTTDRGASWTRVFAYRAGGQIAVSAKYIYIAAGGNEWSPDYKRAAITNDTVWEDVPAPAALNQEGHRIGITYDGQHYIIIAPNHDAGIWRYVEP